MVCWQLLAEVVVVEVDHLGLFISTGLSTYATGIVETDKFIVNAYAVHCHDRAERKPIQTMMLDLVENIAAVCAWRQLGEVEEVRFLSQCDGHGGREEENGEVHRGSALLETSCTCVAGVCGL